MRRATIGAVLLTALGIAFVDLGGAADTTRVGAKIDSAKWESGYGVKFYNVVGTVSNQSGKPLGAVQVRVELLDDGGQVVKSTEVWNATAEALGEASPAAASDKLAKLHTEPLAAGATDKFRASFLEDETPKFAKEQVRVVATVPAQ